MTEEELQKIADKLKNFPGKVKGDIFLNHAEYIKYKEGDEGIKKVEDKMAELGVPIKIEEVDQMSWQSEGISSLLVIVAKEVFNWTEEDIFEWGRFRTKVSFTLKLVARYFMSIRMLATQAEKLWNKNFDFGEIETILEEDKRRVTLRVKGFNMHPLICIFHSGYFKGVIELCVRSKNIKVEQVKCVHRGDEYCEHLVTW